MLREENTLFSSINKKEMCESWIYIHSGVALFQRFMASNKQRLRI